MAAQTDFWGDMVLAEERTPLAILREQAALLGTKTKNLVEATVDTTVTPDGRFIHRFLLVVPSLSSYKFELFRIRHGITIYPIDTSEPPEPLLRTEQEFVDWLRCELSSAETKRIIANLLAQAMS